MTAVYAQPKRCSRGGCPNRTQRKLPAAALIHPVDGLVIVPRLSCTLCARPVDVIVVHPDNGDDED